MTIEEKAQAYDNMKAHKKKMDKEYYEANKEDWKIRAEKRKKKEAENE